MNNFLNQPDVPQPVFSSSKSNWLRRHKKLVLELAGGFIIFGAIVGLIIYQIWSGRAPTSSANPPVQQWTKTVKYTACDQGKHQAISFQKPVAFTVRGTLTNEADLSYGYYGGPGGTTIGLLIAGCLNNQSTSSSYLAGASQSILNPGAPDRGTYLRPVYQFVIDHTTANYDLSFQVASPFSNQYIKTNAWEMELALNRTNSAPNNFPAEKQGKIIWLAGKNTWYYVYLAAVQNSWQANGLTWDKILNSIQIDK